MLARFALVLLTISIFPTVTGCHEGLFWRAGKYSPWAQNKWAEEEKIANTLFIKKQRMTDSVAEVLNAPVERRQVVAEELAEVLHRDSVLLLRIHAVQLLAQLDSPAALDALRDASRDGNTDIRLAAVKAWEQQPANVAIQHLQELIGSDTNIDVRLAATRAVGSFSGRQAVQALSLALDDSDPALQLRAMESLNHATGESFGRDAMAWKDYVSRFSDSPASIADRSDEDKLR